MEILIYIESGYADNEICYIGREVRDKYNVKYVSLENNVISKGGLRVLPDYNLAEIDSIDKFKILILCGGSFWRLNNFKNDKLRNLINKFVDNSKMVCAICDAVTFLCFNGYLDNRYHTGNTLDYLLKVCPNYKGKDFYVCKNAVLDNNFITAGGVCNLDFSREIFKYLNVKSDEEIDKWYNLNKNGYYGK